MMSDIERTERIIDTDRPLISVIIPTQNRKQQLRRAVLSVLSQTYQKIEIVIVDDKSENPVELSDMFDVDQLSLRFPVKIVTNTEVKGNGGARNVGIERAEGSLIAFLDDDDYWFPDKLQRQYHRLISEGADVCYCGSIWMEHSRVVRVKDPELTEVRFEHGGPTSVWLLRRSVIDSVGLFDEELPSFTDGEYLFRMNSQVKVTNLNEILYVHNYDTNTITASGNKKFSGLKRFYELHGNELSSRERRLLLTKLNVYSVLAGHSFRYGLIRICLTHPTPKQMAISCVLLLPTFIARPLIRAIVHLAHYPRAFAR